MDNQRKSIRLRHQFNVFVAVPEQSKEGEGSVLNVNAGGILLVTSLVFMPTSGLKMVFSGREAPCVPPEGKLVWWLKLKDDRFLHKCGVIFSPESPQMAPWLKWMEDNYFKLGNIEDNGILDHLLA